MRAREVDDKKVFGTAPESDVLWARRVVWLVKSFGQINTIDTSRCVKQKEERVCGINKYVGCELTP